MHKINVIVPCFNAERNVDKLVNSLLEQTYEKWEAFFIDDISTDSTYEKLISLKLNVIKNTEKKFALRNIVETCYSIDAQTDELITIVDGDDSLCNPKAFELLAEAFDAGNKFIYTKHSWDVDGRNISEQFPIGRNPYATKWVTSHLRAFSLNLLKEINTDNFKDVNGNFFERGYDQCLSLPLLTKAKDKIKFIDEVCYKYNINSVSMPDRRDGGKQLCAVKFIRARGYIK